MNRIHVAILVLLCLSIEGIAQKKTYDTLPNMPEHYVERYALFKKEPVVTGKVVMLGNSITEMGNWKKLLNDTTVINRGIGGDVTFGVMNRLDDVIKRKPSKIFMLIGINDLSRNTPDEVIIENIYNIAYRIHKGSPDTKLFIQSILPLNETFKNFPVNYKGKKEHIIAINGQLGKYGEKLHFTYVDIYSGFIGKDDQMEAKYSTDGLHLTPAGYDHWIEILKKLKYL